MNGNRKRDSPHWKAMGLLVLFGIILIISLSCFPVATRTLLVVGSGTVLLLCGIVPPLLRRHHTHAGPIDSASHTTARSPKTNKPFTRFQWYTALLGIALFLG